MAKQSKKEQAPDLATEGMSKAPVAASDDAASDDPKERFRQALEAKKHRGAHGGQGPAASGPGTKGSSTAAGGRREFRRKSG